MTMQDDYDSEYDENDSAVAETTAVAEGMTPTGQRLRSIIERIERVEEERKALADDIKEIKAEAKAEGFDVKAINTIIKIRKKDPNDRAEEEAILDTYMAALHMK